MSTFNVELKRVVDDTYDISIGYELQSELIDDLGKGLVGKLKKFAVITDTNVRDLYAKPICEKLIKAGFSVDMFESRQVRKARPERQKQR